MTDTGRPDYLVPLKPGEELIFEKIGTDMDKLREKIEEAIAGKTQTCNGITMTFSTPEETLVELLKQALDALPRWVSVEDELPENKVNILLYREREEFCLPGFRDENGSFFALTADIGLSWHSGVTHWMPLPTSPTKAPQPLSQPQADE